jgi:hypothetical protein
MGDGSHRANCGAGWRFAMTTLDRHGASICMGDIQARIGLQTDLAMILNTGSNASIAPDTMFRISNNEAVHCWVTPPFARVSDLYRLENCRKGLYTFYVLPEKVLAVEHTRNLTWVT